MISSFHVIFLGKGLNSVQISFGLYFLKQILLSPISGELFKFQEGG